MMTARRGRRRRGLKPSPRLTRARVGTPQTALAFPFFPPLLPPGALPRTRPSQAREQDREIASLPLFFLFFFAVCDERDSRPDRISTRPARRNVEPTPSRPARAAGPFPLLSGGVHGASVGEGPGGRPAEADHWSKFASLPFSSPPSPFPPPPSLFSLLASVAVGSDLPQVQQQKRRPRQRRASRGARPSFSLFPLVSEQARPGNDSPLFPFFPFPLFRTHLKAIVITFEPSATGCGSSETANQSFFFFSSPPFLPR